MPLPPVPQEDLWSYPRARILDVTDADTFTARVDLGLDTHRILTLRLWGVDAPETRLTAGVTAAEKRQGLYMRDALRERLNGSEVSLLTIKDRREKYGRYLAIVTHQGDNVNEWVLAATTKWREGGSL